MACEVRRVRGVMMVVCTRGRKAPNCRRCGKTSTKLCDYPLKGSKAGQTCDMPVCDAHATRVGPDKDYCPVHARLAEREKQLSLGVEVDGGAGAG